ncbi:hypothetical protein IWT140_00160 [Secundilactobacillus pentosiphilus]|uniref:Uncharacterized protein n=1 Tax=Secundilactobacillus pentosiphilus TaxID=1714682 RepID=A0A1Z5ILE4_9LACO|nr:hypothetical protein [Secundilactobacillus pentosiphilus]GAX02563.1 hypothetical protein IWT140_00160 [Secundilactobacillus pentosiphilus]
MRKLSLIIGSLAVAGTLAVGSQPAKAATYHNGNPKTIQGYWRTASDHGVYDVYHFGKSSNTNVYETKSRSGWHVVRSGYTSLDPKASFNYPARYRKLSAHTYYLIPTKKSAHYHYVGAKKMKIYKKSSKKMAIKYYYAKVGWGVYQWLYKK